MRQTIVTPLLLCAAAAFAYDEDVSPLEAADRLMKDTKHALQKVLSHNPRMASEWNDLMGLSQVDDELRALTRELSDMEEEEGWFGDAVSTVKGWFGGDNDKDKAKQQPAAAAAAAAASPPPQQQQQQPKPMGSGNEMCFSKMFKPCTVTYGKVSDHERRNGNKDIVQRMGDDCMSGISSCGHGFAPLICVTAGKDEHGVGQPASQPMCPTGTDSQNVGPATQQMQGCCVGAYPFEDCARNPLCKHAASPAWLEAKGQFSEALFARAIVDKQVANSRSGGDVQMKFELSDDEKKALVGNLTDCPPQQAKGCSVFALQEECEKHYKVASTNIPGQFQPCIWNEMEFTCRAKTGMPAPTPTPVGQAEETYDKPDGPVWYTSVYAAAPKAPTGKKPEFKAAAPADGPPEFCLGPSLALSGYTPQFNYRNAGNVPKRPESPMNPTQVFQPIAGWGGGQ